MSSTSASSVPFPTAEEVAELRRLDDGSIWSMYDRQRLAELLPSLLAAASFALKAEDFLREHRKHLTMYCVVAEGEDGVVSLGLADLLRSLPARDEAGRDV